jgi:quercetin dioxygenase-like cupin family protein
MTKRGMMGIGIAIALVAGIWGMQHASAQAPAGAAASPAAPAGFKRTELGRHDISKPNHEVVTARADFQPGAQVPRHTHPGEEVAYVLEGELELQVDGKPAQKLKAGDTFFLPANTVHAAKNIGKGPAAVLSNYLVEKGKPLATPAK